MQKILAAIILLALMLSALMNTAAESVVLPEGEYVVGVSLPEGTYTLSLPAGATILIGGQPIEVLDFSKRQMMPEFGDLNAQFKNLTEEMSGYNAAIDLCDEFDELLAILTTENNGLDSASELSMKVRYYKVKDQLRALPGGIVTAEDGSLEDFKKQVEKLRRVMTTLREEAKKAMVSNLSQQAEQYAKARTLEQDAAEKLKNALDMQSDLVQSILALEAMNDQGD